MRRCTSACQPPRLNGRVSRDDVEDHCHFTGEAVCNATHLVPQATKAGRRVSISRGRAHSSGDNDPNGCTTTCNEVQPPQERDPTESRLSTRSRSVYDSRLPR